MAVDLPPAQRPALVQGGQDALLRGGELPCLRRRREDEFGQDVRPPRQAGREHEPHAVDKRGQGVLRNPARERESAMPRNTPQW